MFYYHKIAEIICFTIMIAICSVILNLLSIKLEWKVKMWPVVKYKYDKKINDL